MVPEQRRIKFSKTGKLRYISHLDLCRTMQLAFIRSKVPIWYTEGFNPHPKMVFALTVSTGEESVCELLDIKITEDISNERLAEMLNSVLTPELYIEKVYKPTEKFTEIAYSGYTVDVFEGPDAKTVKEKLKGELMVTRRTKSGDVTADISDMVKSCEVGERDGRVFIKCVLCATQNKYLNPEYLAKALDITDCDIVRTGIYKENGEEFI